MNDQVAGAERFAEIWQGNEMTAVHPAMAEALDAANVQTYGQAEPSTVYITDVTLRDGQQQQMDPVTTEQRIEVFDTIVGTGVDRIEIGHLGNKNGDQELASALIDHIAHKEQEDELYRDVKLQVLFGSHEELIQDGSAVLAEAFQRNYPETWREEMSKRVVVHVYDRVDPALLDTASEPYGLEESARRICVASSRAIDAGFTQFSISGEATTAIDPDSAVQFYRSITQHLFEDGAENVNINLPNTYGYSANHNWNLATFASFNAAVKYGFDGGVTTSIHPHNDVDNAVGVSMAAIVAGFDRVEGTGIGVGERTGNVSTTDVMARFIEQARHQILHEQQEQRISRIARAASRLSVQRTVNIDERIVSRLDKWHGAGERIAEIFGRHAIYRWRRTAVGNVYAHDNGSGPHDHAMAAAITDPVRNPGDSNYEWALLSHSILGRPETEDIAVGDPDAVNKITVANHAAGGTSWAIKKGELPRASGDKIEQARREFRQRKQEVIQKLLDGVLVVGA